MDAPTHMFCYGRSEHGRSNHGAQGDCGNCVARQISICSNVDDSGLAKLRAISSHASFPVGKVIFDQDQRMDRVFIVIKGMIKLYHLLADGQRQITGFLGPGDVLGGIKRHAHSHCAAEAITEVKVCGFERAGLLRLLQEHPDLCLRLLIAATDEIEAQHFHAVLLGRKRASERLAAFILLIGQRWEKDNGGPNVVHLPMSRADIADHLGQTVESVSRGLTQLRTLGYIELPKPSMVILKNIPALYHLSGFEELPEQSVTLGI